MPANDTPTTPDLDALRQAARARVLAWNAERHPDESAPGVKKTDADYQREHETAKAERAQRTAELAERVKAHPAFVQYQVAAEDIADDAECLTFMYFEDYLHGVSPYRSAWHADLAELSDYKRRDWWGLDYRIGADGRKYDTNPLWIIGPTVMRMTGVSDPWTHKTRRPLVNPDGSKAYWFMSPETPHVHATQLTLLWLADPERAEAIVAASHDTIRAAYEKASKRPGAVPETADEVDDADPNSRMGYLLQVIEDNPGMSTVKLTEQSGRRKAAVVEDLQLLLSAGRVERRSGPRNAKLWYPVDTSESDGILADLDADPFI